MKSLLNHIFGFAPLGKQTLQKLDLTPAPPRDLDTLDGYKLNFLMDGLP